MHGSPRECLPCSWFSFSSALLLTYFPFQVFPPTSKTFCSLSFHVKTSAYKLNWSVLLSAVYYWLCLSLSFNFIWNSFSTNDSSFIYFSIMFQGRNLIRSIIPFLLIEFSSCTPSWPPPIPWMTEFALSLFILGSGVRAGEVAARVGSGDDNVVNSVAIYEWRTNLKKDIGLAGTTRILKLVH